MSVSKHNVAIFEEEGFMLIEVEDEKIQIFGEETVLNIIENHNWVQDQEIPVVIFEQNEDGDTSVYGDEEFFEIVFQLEFSDMAWTQEIALSWPDYDDFDHFDYDDDFDDDDFDDDNFDNDFDYDDYDDYDNDNYDNDDNDDYL